MSDRQHATESLYIQELAQLRARIRELEGQVLEMASQAARGELKIRELTLHLERTTRLNDELSRRLERIHIARDQRSRTED